MSELSEFASLLSWRWGSYTVNECTQSLRYLAMNDTQMYQGLSGRPLGRNVYCKCKFDCVFFWHFWQKDASAKISTYLLNSLVLQSNILNFWTTAILKKGSLISKIMILYCLQLYCFKLPCITLRLIAYKLLGKIPGLQVILQVISYTQWHWLIKFEILVLMTEQWAFFFPDFIDRNPGELVVFTLNMIRHC